MKLFPELQAHPELSCTLTPMLGYEISSEECYEQI
jgi:hypothetical protein